MLADPWIPLEPEIVQAMIALVEIQPGDYHVELGAGDGRFMVAAQALGATSVGYEIDVGLVTQARAQGLNIKQADCLDALMDVRKADVITAWFTVEPYTSQLLTFIKKNMKRGARFVFLYDSRRGGNILESDPNWGMPNITWTPTTYGQVKGNRFWLYRA